LSDSVPQFEGVPAPPSPDTTFDLARTAMQRTEETSISPQVADPPAPFVSSQPLQVFVSHSHWDCKFVETNIVFPLHNHGINPWYSGESIPSGAHWERQILQGLEKCDWFLLVMSPRSAQSEYVKDEVHWAIDHRPEKIVPVLMEDCNSLDFHIRLSRGRPK